MKLKGRLVQNLKKAVKDKMEGTLARMKKVRKTDSENLRNIIEQKLKWAISEKKKGDIQKKKLENSILRLEGIIIFCNDILNPNIKKGKNDKDKN